MRPAFIEVSLPHFAGTSRRALILVATQKMTVSRRRGEYHDDFSIFCLR